MTALVIFSAASRAQVLAAEVDYVSQIKPLLAHKCYSCHGVLKQEAGLRLDTLAFMKSGGDSGSVLANHDDSSLLIQRVAANEDSRMPPPEDGAALKPSEVQLLQQWIKEGAHAPAEEVVVGPQDHWAFQAIQRPPLPTNDPHQNPIDVLLDARRQERGLKTLQAATRSLLIRRLYLDLIGLPPGLDQLRDSRPWAVIVDELLASPLHGERWGRHWMDVWRYSDWYGLGAQLRYSQKHMWHWRDWIIESLNNDKGYDRMILEMLAGDEIVPLNQQAVTGTGFLARNYYLFNRTTWLDSTIEHTGKAFLGLTLNCAKCHDHKYDPITHEDYYSFRAIFEPHQVRLDPLPGVTDFAKDGLPRVFDDHLDVKTSLHLRGDPMNPDPDTKIGPRIPELFESFQPKITPVQLPPAAYAPGVRSYVQQDRLNDAKALLSAARADLTAAKQKLADLALTSAENAKEAAPSSSVTFAFTDDFETSDAEAWELVGDWQYKNGTLLRTTSTRERQYVRLRRPLPQDFEMKCRYTTKGGDVYKSVTFRFDESADGKYANYVYTSAHAPGPKVQVAYSREGRSVYPAAGRKAKTIKVGQELNLQIAVRNGLVNVWLNDEFQVAYEFPDRKVGAFSMQGFDATVAFDAIEFRTLPEQFEMRPAKNATKASPIDLQAAVEIAVAKMKSAEANLVSIRATIAADNEQFGDASGRPSSSALQTHAAISQTHAEIAAAEYEIAAAAGDAKKVKTAEAKLQTATQRLEAAERGEVEYSPIKATLKALEGPAHKQADYPAVYSKTSTGRRTALVEWMTSQKNPLTARVAVNHVWMRHFGEPLVESVFDFGLRANKPVHADVLDYLAADFMHHNWSFKHLHRLIVTSKTYQLSSALTNGDKATLENDPANACYWRMNTRRMESQVVRDSLLALAGTLDLKQGGPSLGVGDGSTRRSLYYKHSRDQQNKFLSMFDDADLLQCYRRSESIVPQQALALANSKVSLQNAQKIADRISESLEDTGRKSFIATAIETLLGRPAVGQEEQHCLSFCEDLDQLLLNSNLPDRLDREARIRNRLVHALINHNDFVSIR